MNKKYEQNMFDVTVDMNFMIENVIYSKNLITINVNASAKTQ